MNKPCLILERSSQNLRKIGDSKKIILEGVFAVFGEENRNGRIYEETQYLPHLEYLKDEVQAGSLLGELDHPERFEVALSNVSHRITEIWYEPSSRQVKGKIEILEGTPRGQIAKALLDAGVPLSISSRAAGTVLENHKVQIQQIYTYDLVAKPGFAQAQLYSVSESRKAEIMEMANTLNESYNHTENKNISKSLGFNNENLTIIEMPENSVVLKPAAKKVLENLNKEYIHKNDKKTNMNTPNAQKRKLAGTDENKTIKELREELVSVKEYVEELRKIQESSINWQTDMAKAINKIATFADELSESNDTQQDLNKKICETLDYNADVVNNMQAWTSSLAKGINDVNNKTKLVEAWLADSNAKSQSLSEWTSKIAEHLNKSIDYTETMFGRAVSKGDTQNILSYIDSIKEGKEDKKLRKTINESMDNTNLGQINESDYATKMDKQKSIKIAKDDNKVSIPTNVSFDATTKTITAKLSKSTFSKSTKPKELKTLDGETKTEAGKVKSESNPLKGEDMTKTKTIKVTDKDNDKSVKKSFKDKQALSSAPIKESFDKKSEIEERRSSLDEKLLAIAKMIDAERAQNESVKHEYPFTTILSEQERQSFIALDKNTKDNISEQIRLTNACDYVSVKRVYESVISNGVVNEPLWLKSAPANYKELYNNAPAHIKESINAKSAFFNLDTYYQIENFWQNSGLNENASVSMKLKNDVIASNIAPDMIAESVDSSYINNVGAIIKSKKLIL